MYGLQRGASNIPNILTQSSKVLLNAVHTSVTTPPRAFFFFPTLVPPHSVAVPNALSALSTTPALPPCLA